ncbi:MAG: hypothetical protein ACYC6N_29760 [Pirellulaceae bacterium]
MERDPGQLAEYQRRLRAARYRVPFVGPQDTTRTSEWHNRCTSKH